MTEIQQVIQDALATLPRHPPEAGLAGGLRGASPWSWPWRPCSTGRGCSRVGRAGRDGSRGLPSRRGRPGAPPDRPAPMRRPSPTGWRRRRGKRRRWWPPPSIRPCAGPPSAKRWPGSCSIASTCRAAEAIRVAPPTFRGRLRAPAVLAVAAAAALVALVALQGGQGLLRMLLPWQASPYTSLALEGPAEALAEGQAFTLTARVSGVPVEKVTLYRQDSPEPLAEAAPDEQGLVRLAVDGLDGPADFVARGGDGRSEPLRVEPYPLPGIEAFEIAVTPPGYAAHAADTETDPSFSAFRGSRLRYRIRLKAPAVSVAVERSAVPRKEERVTAEERATLRARPVRGTRRRRGTRMPKNPTARSSVPTRPTRWCGKPTGICPTRRTSSTGSRSRANTATSCATTNRGASTCFRMRRRRCASTATTGAR